MPGTVTINPTPIRDSNGVFTISGKVSSNTGIKSVTIYDSIEDQKSNPTGSVKVASDGTFSFEDELEGLKRDNYQAKAFFTDGTNALSAASPFTFYANGNESAVTSNNQLASTTTFAKDGSSTVGIFVGGQSFQSNFFD